MQKFSIKLNDKSQANKIMLLRDSFVFYEQAYKSEMEKIRGIFTILNATHINFKKNLRRIDNMYTSHLKES